MDIDEELLELGPDATLCCSPVITIRRERPCQAFSALEGLEFATRSSVEHP